MNIDIQVDARKAIKELNDVGERQLPFALARALNATYLDVQKAERANLHSKFKLRRASWAEKSVKFSHFATKREPWVTFGFHPQGGESKRDILGKFETQTEKRPIDGRTIAVPQASSLFRKGTGIIPHRNRPSALNLRRDGRRVIGDRGTFVIRKADGSGLILQRLGKGRGRRGVTRSSGVQALYVLALRARLKPNLEFRAIAERVVNQVFEKHMLREFDNAMRTAR